MFNKNPCLLITADHSLDVDLAAFGFPHRN